MSALHFDLHAAGVLAPGLASLADLRRTCRSGIVCANPAPLVLPVPAALPANERRRASHVVRLALACIEQALQVCPFPADTLRSVFATDEGTGEVCRQMLETLSTTRQVSPLLFTNSVHNAPSGHFSIAWHNRQASTVVSAGPDSVAAGLLCAVTETVATGQPVLFVAYDPAMVAPMDEILPITEPTATAWILSGADPAGSAPTLGSFRLELEPAAAADAPTPRPAWLPARWASNSSADALALLGLLEAGPEAVHRLTLGGRWLRLQRRDGERP